MNCLECEVSLWNYRDGSAGASEKVDIEYLVGVVFFCLF